MSPILALFGPFVSRCSTTTYEHAIIALSRCGTTTYKLLTGKKFVDLSRIFAYLCVVVLIPLKQHRRAVQQFTPHGRFNAMADHLQPPQHTQMARFMAVGARDAGIIEPSEGWHKAFGLDPDRFTFGTHCTRDGQIGWHMLDWEQIRSSN